MTYVLREVIDTSESSVTTSDGEQAAASAAEAVLLTDPRDGLPPLITSPGALDAAVSLLAAGSGPLAVDAERAGGYRYGHRAYLLQFRRAGAGTFLIDPITLPDLARIQQELGELEWILHAASQDLPCLTELGLTPTGLFDTELAGRLLGLPRVGLATLVEAYLGLRLAKEHSAVDWSTRPLPEPWLRYAALDVEVLVELRDLLAADLVAAGRLDWALQEFEFVRRSPVPPPRADPWRRVSGIHRLRKPRQLALAREMWLTRDSIARERDIAPGRILPDASIVAVAAQAPDSEAALGAMAEFRGRGQRRRVATWWSAVARAMKLPADQLPGAAVPGDGPPPPRSWAQRDPEAAARLAAARAGITATAQDLNLPAENLIAPDTVRRLCWNPPEDLSDAALRRALETYRARPWQIAMTVPVLSDALTSQPVGEVS